MMTEVTFSQAPTKEEEETTTMMTEVTFSKAPTTECSTVVANSTKEVGCHYVEGTV